MLFIERYQEKTVATAMIIKITELVTMIYMADLYRFLGLISL